MKKLYTSLYKAETKGFSFVNKEVNKASFCYYDIPKLEVGCKERIKFGTTIKANVIDLGGHTKDALCKPVIVRSNRFKLGHFIKNIFRPSKWVYIRNSYILFYEPID